MFQNKQFVHQLASHPFSVRLDGMEYLLHSANHSPILRILVPS